MKLEALQKGIVLTPSMELEILELATHAGFKVHIDMHYDRAHLRVGNQTFLIPVRSMYKRLLAELVELSSSRIAFSNKIEYLDTLKALSKPVLKRAIMQGLRERNGE